MSRSESSIETSTQDHGSNAAGQLTSTGWRIYLGIFAAIATVISQAWPIVFGTSGSQQAFHVGLTFFALTAILAWLASFTPMQGLFWPEVSGGLRSILARLALHLSVFAACMAVCFALSHILVYGEVRPIHDWGRPSAFALLFVITGSFSSLYSASKVRDGAASEQWLRKFRPAERGVVLAHRSIVTGMFVFALLAAKDRLAATSPDPIVSLSPSSLQWRTAPVNEDDWDRIASVTARLIRSREASGSWGESAHWLRRVIEAGMLRRHQYSAILALDASALRLEHDPAASTTPSVPTLRLSLRGGTVFGDLFGSATIIATRGEHDRFAALQYRVPGEGRLAVAADGTPASVIEFRSFIDVDPMAVPRPGAVLQFDLVDSRGKSLSGVEVRLDIQRSAAPVPTVQPVVPVGG
ncbi:MAG: hypothetical protein ACK55O_01170 [Phycisphaerales bacterium]|jgi:hypothetical protein|nr:hypothetical protein [Phycisphaeraceae bacterium]